MKNQEPENRHYPEEGTQYEICLAEHGRYFATFERDKMVWLTNGNYVFDHTLVNAWRPATDISPTATVPATESFVELQLKCGEHHIASFLVEFQDWMTNEFRLVRQDEVSGWRALTLF